MGAALALLFCFFFGGLGSPRLPCAGGDCLACLPKAIKLDEVVSVERSKSGQGEVVKKITIGETLKKWKARCRGGKLVDGAGKEIYFYLLIGCWGNPPAHYQELLDHQRQEIEQLSKKYRVMQIPCDQLDDPRRRN